MRTFLCLIVVLTASIASGQHRYPAARYQLYGRTGAFIGHLDHSGNRYNTYQPTGRYNGKYDQRGTSLYLYGPTGRFEGRFDQMPEYNRGRFAPLFGGSNWTTRK